MTTPLRHGKLVVSRPTYEVTPINFIVRDTFLEAYEKGWADPVYFDQTFLDKDPHDGQIQWVRGGRPWAKERTCAAANRWGKTFVEGMELVRRAFYQVRDQKFDIDPKTGKLNPYTAISIAMSLDQSKLAWTYGLTCVEESPKMRPFLKDVKETPFPLFTLESGVKGEDRVYSEVWARSTAKKARYLLGRKFNFISWDEAAWDPDGAEILNNVIRMRLVDQAGEIDFISTPNAKNWFYTQYLLGLVGTPTYGGRRYYAQTGITTENTFVDAESIVLQASRMSDDMIAQNIFGEFVEFSSIFPFDDIANCYRDQTYSLPVPPGYVVEYHESDNELDLVQVKLEKMQGKYVVGCDLGRKMDPTCIIVLRVDVVPAQVHSYTLIEKTRWEAIYNTIATACRIYKAPVMIDATAIGDPIEETLKSEPYNLEVVGFIFSQRSKQNLITELQAAIQTRQITFPYIESLVRSLTMYRLEDRKLFTDPVMALALAWKLAMERYFRTADAINTLSPVISGRYWDYVNGIYVMREVRGMTRDGKTDPLAALWADEEQGSYEDLEANFTR